MLKDTELLLKVGETGEEILIDKSLILEREDKDNTGLVYVGALPEGSATTCADIDGTDGGTTLILKFDIVGVAPKDITDFV